MDELGMFYAPAPALVLTMPHTGPRASVRMNAIRQSSMTGTRLCDDRCVYAKGHDCNCSCSGKNHGKGLQSFKGEVFPLLLASASSQRPGPGTLDRAQLGMGEQ